MGNGKFVSTFALIQPNGNWSFADDMSAFVVDKQTDEKGQTSLANVDIISALSHIKNVVMPDAAIVHLVCEKGNNTYRYRGVYVLENEFVTLKNCWFKIVCHAQ